MSFMSLNVRGGPDGPWFDELIPGVHNFGEGTAAPLATRYHSDAARLNWMDAVWDIGASGSVIARVDEGDGTLTSYAGIGWEIIPAPVDGGTIGSPVEHEDPAPDFTEDSPSISTPGGQSAVYTVGTHNAALDSNPAVTNYQDVLVTITAELMVSPIFYGVSEPDGPLPRLFWSVIEIEVRYVVHTIPSWHLIPNGGGSGAGGESGRWTSRFNMPLDGTELVIDPEPAAPGGVQFASDICRILLRADLGCPAGFIVDGVEVGGVKYWGERVSS